MRTVCHNLDVAHFHARRHITPENLALVDASATDTGPGKQPHHATITLARSESVLAINAQINIVGDGHRTAKSRFQ